MTSAPQVRVTTSFVVGGALLTLAGLFILLALLGTVGGSLLFLLSAIAIAIGAALMAVGLRGAQSIVGSTRIGRVALILFGVAPLGEMLPPAQPPLPPVLVGMTILVLATAATVVTAVYVARAGVLQGVARWTPVVIAADAVVTAAMSSVPLGDFPFAYLSWHLELIRPLALIVWGVSVALHGRASAIRRTGTALNEAWRASTDVGAKQIDDLADRYTQP